MAFKLEVCISAPISPGGPVSSSPVSRPNMAIVLKQAKERTKLVVDCAALVQRMEELDSHIAQYDEWQNYPDDGYAQRVRLRFEEARRREAAESKTLHFTTGSTLQPSTTASRPASAHVRSSLPEDETERKLAVAHLQRALHAAEFEAEVWRHRAVDMEQASEQEKQQAKDLQAFELSAALQEAATALAQLSDQAAQLVSLRIELHEAYAQSRDLKQVISKLDHEHRSFSATAEQESEKTHAQISNFSVQLASLRAELDEAHTHNLTLAQSIIKLQREHALLSADCDNCSEKLDCAHQEVESRNVEVMNLGRLIASKDSDLRAVQKIGDELRADQESNCKMFEALEVEFHKANEERVSQSSQIKRLEIKSQNVQCEYEARLKTLVGAQKRSEFLDAKCKNLEAALEHSSLQQAELAMEKDAFRSQAESLRLRIEVHTMEDDDGIQMDGKPSVLEVSVSCQSTALGSTSSSTGSNPTIQVVPPSKPQTAISPTIRSPKTKIHQSRIDNRQQSCPESIHAEMPHDCSHLY